MRYAVCVLARAEREASQIVGWIAQRSTTGAVAWVDAFEVALQSLAESPEARGLAPEDALIDHARIRHVIFKTKKGRPYRALFTIVGNEVRVLHVRTPGQPTVRRIRMH